MAKTKEYINGMPLREYIIMSLTKKTFRELIKDERFIGDTNISVLGTLTHHTKKHKITIEEVYKYGTDNLLILPSVSFEDWMIKTNREGTLKAMKNKKTRSELRKEKSKKNLLLKILEEMGMGDVFTIIDEEEEMNDFLLDFIDQSEIDGKIKEFRKRR